MRGAFLPSCNCGAQRKRKKNTRASEILLILLILLTSTMLRAQSESNSQVQVKGLEFADDPRQSGSDRRRFLGFKPEANPIAAEVTDSAAPEPLSARPPITFEGVCTTSRKGDIRSCVDRPTSLTEQQHELAGKEDEPPRETVKASGLIAQTTKRLDRNLDIYYRNRREFSLDVGWHPVNVPFIYDFAVGDSYNMTPLKYTLVPIIASLRWHVTNVGWRWIFRGNMDFTFSGSVTPIPRGPETHYYSFDFGIRRNFVYRNWKVVPFFEQRGGAGIIDAKEPLGVLFSQGQNLTFTYNLGVGARYNIDSKYSFSAGMNYMHISNGYLSEPQFTNYGINVYGPMFGIDVRLGKPHHTSE